MSKNSEGPFRVVSNGLKFKVQTRVSRGWWWWKREAWEDLGVNYPALGFIPTTYATLKEAQERIEEWNHEKVMRHEWRPVSFTMGRRGWSVVKDVV